MGRGGGGFPADLAPLALVGPVGAAAMLLLKDYENIWLSAVASVAAITVAAAWYQLGRERYDLDRAGDATYYLGLCYTLSALIYTLAHHFGSGGGEREAADVVPAFGVALASTLAGVVARIWLQACAAQDEEEEEDFSAEPLTPERMRSLYGDRLSLAAQAIARELRTTTIAFAQLNRAAFQQADQMVRRAEEAGEREAQRMDSAFRRTGDEVSRLAGTVEKLNTAVGRSAQGAVEAAHGVKRSVEAAGEALDAASGLSRSAKEVGDALAEGAKAAAAGAQSAERCAAAAEQAIKRMEVLADVVEELGRSAGRSAAAAAEAAGRSEESARAANEALHAFSSQVHKASERMEVLADMVAELGRSAGRSAAAAAEAAGRSEESARATNEALHAFSSQVRKASEALVLLVKQAGGRRGWWFRWFRGRGNGQ